MKFYLLESEKDTFKKIAVIFAGIPGAGKSTIINKMFNFDKFNISTYNAKKVNPDIYLEKKFKGKKINWEEDKEKYDNEWQHAVTINQKFLNHFIKNKLPIIIDSVGRFPNYTLNLAENLKKVGYIVYMIYVKAELKTAIDRNNSRDRKIEESFIKGAYRLLKDNYSIYKDYFKNKMIVIDNNKLIDNEELVKIGKKIMGK